MKKSVSLIALAIIGVACWAFAEAVTWKPFSNTTFGTATIAGDSSTTTTVITADSFVGAVTGQATSVASQSDTNTTTTVTSYTPAFTGQVLIGGAGTGTNAVWIAKGTTTNDWVQVAP